MVTNVIVAVVKGENRESNNKCDEGVTFTWLNQLSFEQTRFCNNSNIMQFYDKPLLVFNHTSQKPAEVVRFSKGIVLERII